MLKLFITMMLLYTSWSVYGQPERYHKYKAEAGRIVYCYDTCRSECGFGDSDDKWFVRRPTREIVVTFKDYGANEILEGNFEDTSILRAVNKDSIQTVYYKNGTSTIRKRKPIILPELYVINESLLYQGFARQGFYPKRYRTKTKVLGYKCRGEGPKYFYVNLNNYALKNGKDHFVGVYYYKNIPFRIVYWQTDANVEPKIVYKVVDFKML